MSDCITPDLSGVRTRFPALAQTGPGGRPFAYFDGPAGTQVPAAVSEAPADY